MDNFKDNETDIQHLIISSLEGTASEEELLVLQNGWKNQSSIFFYFQHTDKIGYKPDVYSVTRPRRLGRK